MKHFEEVQSLKTVMKKTIYRILEEMRLDTIHFENPPIVMVSDEDSYGEFCMVSCYLNSLDYGGNITGKNTTDGELHKWSLEDLSLEELAWVLDNIETGNFSSEPEDDLSEDDKSMSRGFSMDDEEWDDNFGAYYPDKDDIDPAGGHGIGSHI
jgi:hypothetical protein